MSADNFGVTSTALIRRLSILRAYDLRAKLDRAGCEQEREQIILDEALNQGRDITALRCEARWTELIKQADLWGAFGARGIGEDEWLERIGPDHMEAVSWARRGSLVLPSREMAGWIVEAHLANWSVQELKQALREAGLLRPEPQMSVMPSQDPMVSDVLIEFAEWLKKSGHDAQAYHLHLDIRRRPLNPQDLLYDIQSLMQRLYGRVIIPREMVRRWASGRVPGARREEKAR